MALRRQQSESSPTPIAGSATQVRSDPVYVVRAKFFRVLGNPYGSGYWSSSLTGNAPSQTCKPI
jgi:hypothetical protein